MGEESTYGAGLGDGSGEGTPPISENQVSENEGRQPEPQEPTGDEPITLTRKDLESLIDQRVSSFKNDAVEEATRRAQSMTDKLGSRLDKEIASALKEAKSTIELVEQGGVKLTQAQQEDIRDRLIKKAYSKLENDEQPLPEGTGAEAKQPTQDPSGNPANQLIAAEVSKIMAETGVYIPPAEANKLILGEDGSNKLSPFEYVEAFRSLAQQRQFNNQAASRGANPNLPSYAEGGRSGKSNAALRQQYENELAKIAKNEHPSIKRGQWKAIQDLEISYRKRGLDI